MSGKDLPYQLRPSKFIDRQIFVEALSRLIQVRGPEKYVYVSMGGRHLVDHYAVYKELGIRSQYSFDDDKNLVARQLFNRPTDATICNAMNSSALPSKLDEILNAFPMKRNLIVWLDYTTTERKVQLQEAEQVLSKLRHGDIFRITMNSEAGLKQGSGTPAERSRTRASALREQIEDFMPTAITSIGEGELPKVLSKCIELVAAKAKIQEPGLEFDPVLCTSYADGQRMITVTVAVRDITSKEKYPNLEFRRWPFSSATFDDIHEISVPVLSAKERFKLDMNLKKGAKRMLAALKFLPAADIPESIAVLSSYRKFQRFYPAFRHVDD